MYSETKAGSPPSAAVTSVAWVVIGVALLVFMGVRFVNARAAAENESSFHPGTATGGGGAAEAPLPTGATTQAAMLIGAPLTGERLARAQLLYNRSCVVCHGDLGDGKGAAAVGLDPQPRSFRAGKYRWVTSANGVPFKSDVVNTIKHGLAGTSMPAWRDLSEADIDLLADYVLAFTRSTIEHDLAARKLRPRQVQALVDAKMKASEPVMIPPEPPITGQGLARGKELFLQTCAKCHGDDGAGRADPSWKTEEGFPIASRNFTSNIFKGGGRKADLYTRIYAGMPGTPMPAFASLGPDDIWHVVHYTLTLSDPKNRPSGNSAGAGSSASSR